MSDINNEADSLFATRRKKIQDEEAQKEAQRAEKERLEELERQRQAMLEDIKRLENIQAEQKAQAEKNAQDAQRVQESLKSKEAGKTVKGDSPIKKYLPFIIIGASAVLITVVVIILVNVLSKPKNDKAATDTGNGNITAEKDPVASKGKISESDPAETEDYDSEIQGGVSDMEQETLKDLLSRSVWYKLDDSGSESSFIYPSIFSEQMDLEEDGDYVFTYNDPDSGQIIEIAFSVLKMGEEAELSEEDYYTILGMLISVDEVESKAVQKAENIWYITESFDDKQAGDQVLTVYSARKDDKFVEFYAAVSKEDVGCRRYIDFEDVDYIFDMMFDSVSVG